MCTPYKELILLQSGLVTQVKKVVTLNTIQITHLLSKLLADFYHQRENTRQNSNFPYCNLDHRMWSRPKVQESNNDHEIFLWGYTTNNKMMSICNFQQGLRPLGSRIL